MLEEEIKKASDKAKVILEAKSDVSSSSSKKPEVVLSFDETKIKSIKEIIKTIVSVREKGEYRDFKAIESILCLLCLSSDPTYRITSCFGETQVYLGRCCSWSHHLCGWVHCNKYSWER